MANETYDNKPLSILNDGSIESALQLTSNIGNKVDADQELLDMDNLSLSSPTKYLATYSNPKDWILDESEAKSAQLLRAGMYPEQSSEVGSLAYSAGEMLRKTENIGRSFLGFAKGVDAYFAPNADKEQAWRAYNDFQKYAVQQEQNRAEYVEGRGVDPDVYGIGTNVMEVARDIVLTGGLAALSRRGAAKAAYKRASQYVAPEVAERFAIQKGKQAATRAATGSIVGSTFVREAGDRATEQAAKYMELTGDYDLKYYDPTLDFALNTGVSALNSVVEASLGVERIVPDMLFGRRGVGTVATEALKNYLGERSEEFIQNVLGQGADVLSGYADNIDFLDAWTESGVAGIIGAAFGTLSSGGMYYLNRRRMIRQLQETGMPPQTAREVTDKFLRNGINNTLQNLSSAVELKTQEGQAWEKLVNGVKTAMETVDFATDTERTAQATAWAKTNSNIAIRQAFKSGLTIDEWLDIAEFKSVNNGQNLNMVFVKPLGSVQDIDDRIKEQDEIINRQNELRKTGADDKDAMRLAKQRKAILQKAKAIKQYNDAQYKAQIKAQTTPETAKEIETATKDVESVKSVTQAEFDSKVDTENLTSAEKSKRYGNAVLKSILPTKTDFDAVMVDPIYANAKQAIIAVADRINSFIKAHRTYGLKTDISNALQKMQTVNQGNFIESVTTPALDGQDVIAENAFLYHFLFSDATTIQTYLDSYITRAEDSLNQKKGKLSKKDLVGQSFKATDNAMQTQAQVIGAEYTSIYNEDGSYADKNVMAVMLSYQNQFVQEQPKVKTIEYSDSEVLGIFAKAKNNGDITLNNWENVRWSSLLSAGDTYQKGKRHQPATEAEKAKFARKMLDKYLPGWNQVSEPQQLTLFQEQFDLADENARLDDIYPAYDGETIEVDGKERTVYNSNGDRIAKSAEALRNFYKWFGDSKVVDEQGRPLVVYHGSKSVFDTFDNTVNQTKERQMGADLGYFFTDSEYVANKFRTKEQQLEEAGYYIENTVREPVTEEKYDAQGRYLGSVHYTKATLPPYKNFGLYKVYLKAENIVEYQGESLGVWDVRESALKSAKASGKDGMIIYKADTGGGIANEYIVFEPNQIKSVDNRGTYSADTGNIYYQAAYAGSAVDYDRPSLEAIGSGEGSAVHGWGLYYALDPEIAENYMTASRASYEANKIMSLDQEFETLKVDGKPILDVYDIDIDRTLLDLLAWKPYGVVEEELEKRISKWEQLSKDPDYKFKDYADKKVNAYKRLKNDLFNNGMSLIQKDRGQVHEVDIPEMVDLLDEQKTYAEQSEYVKKALRNMLYSVRFQEYYQEGQTAEDFVNQEITDWEQGFNGGQIYDRISNLLDGDKEASLLMKEYGIKGITYFGQQDGRCFVIFDPADVKVLRKKFDNYGNMLFQGKKANGFYDPELGVIVLGRNMNEMTLPHEMQHYWLDKIFNIYKRAKSGELQVRDEWMTETKALFDMLGIDENQTQLTQGQQEKFARMSEAYLTGIGVTGDMNATFKEYQQWVPEKYKSILNLGYLSDDGKIEYPFLDQGAVDFFNKWYANYSLPSLATSPERQEFVNPEDQNGEVLPVSIKEMNNRDKEFGNDAEEQVKTDQRLYNTLDENMPAEIKVEADGQKVVQASRSNFLKESEKQQRRWFERKSRDTEAQLAQDYIEKNPEHAKEVVYGDPELIPNDTGIDRATLINAYMALNNITPESEDWATLQTNIAINQSLAGTQLALSNNTSYRTYLDALREIENAREMKAATNYAGAKQGAVERFNRDIQRFVDEELPKVLATAPNTEARDIALKSLFERARTKFSGNTTGGVLNQMDFDYARGQKGASAAFTRWAVNQIKKDAGAKLNGQEQAQLLNLSAKAQQAVIDLDDRDIGKAVAGAQEIRKWQVEKDKLMGVKPQKFSLFGDYAPRAMLASFNTLVVSNIPSTAMNTAVVRLLEKGILGQNNVSKSLTDSEIKRIKAIYGATAMNLAQMEKPTSPSLLHGEKYSSSGQKWYDPFVILGKEDNWFRVPTFVDTLARIASQDAKATGKNADDVFKEYCRLENQSDEAKLARKQALAVSNMAVFTQDGALARSLNGIRDWINQGSRALIGLDPKGFGLGNLLSPFLKTGANIAEMGIRGSLAPITTISALAQKWRSGKAIDPMKKLALAMDWTYFLLSSVMVSLLAALTSDDDEFYTEPYEMGKTYDPDKPYDSINIAGVWIDLDFFGPFAIPIRTGCRLVKQWKTDNLSAIYKGYGQGLKYAAMDTPLLQEIFNNQMSYAAKKPEDWATGLAYNQANKLIPSQVKPLSRAISRGTGAQFDTGLGKVIERKFHRNYGFDGAELTTQDLIDIFSTKFTYQP